MTTHTVIVFGATGDLGARKIIPALHDVMKTDSKVHWRLIGVAHDQITASDMLERAKVHVHHLDEDVWNKLAASTAYVCGDFNDTQTYATLAGLVTDETCPRIVYCATSSEFFSPITEKSVQTGVLHRQDAPVEGFHYAMYEKPFGKSAASAQEINALITGLLSENQIFRIDHYLAKKGPMSVLGARVIDQNFDELWQRAVFSSLQIVVNEPYGIGSRGHYYDSHGALRDMVQSHLLQFIALLAAKDPEITQPYLSQTKAEVLAACSIEDVVLGQYEGYTQEEYVSPRSKTETFAALKVKIDLPRWRESSLFIKTGKHLAPAGQVMFAVCAPEEEVVGGEETTIGCVVQGDNGVTFVSSKEKVHQSIGLVSPHAAAETLGAYGRIFEFMLEGERTFCVSMEEILHMWRIIDEIIAKKPAVHIYAQGSKGPEELEAFNARYNIEWIL